MGGVGWADDFVEAREVTEEWIPAPYRVRGRLFAGMTGGLRNGFLKGEGVGRGMTAPA